MVTYNLRNPTKHGIWFWSNWGSTNSNSLEKQEAMATYTRESITEKVISITSDKSGYSENEIMLTSAFDENLLMDSLDRIELCMDLEKEFYTSIPDADLETIITVGGMVDHLCEKLNVRQ